MHRIYNKVYVCLQFERQRLVSWFVWPLETISTSTLAELLMVQAVHTRWMRQMLLLVLVLMVEVLEVVEVVVPVRLTLSVSTELVWYMKLLHNVYGSLQKYLRSCTQVSSSLVGSNMSVGETVT